MDHFLVSATILIIHKATTINILALLAGRAVCEGPQEVAKALHIIGSLVTKVYQVQVKVLKDIWMKLELAMFVGIPMGLHLYYKLNPLKMIDGQNF